MLTCQVCSVFLNALIAIAFLGPFEGALIVELWMAGFVRQPLCTTV